MAGSTSPPALVEAGWEYPSNHFATVDTFELESARLFLFTRLVLFIFFAPRFDLRIQCRCASDGKTQKGLAYMGRKSLVWHEDGISRMGEKNGTLPLAGSLAFDYWEPLIGQIH